MPRLSESAYIGFFEAMLLILFNNIKALNLRKSQLSLRVCLSLSINCFWESSYQNLEPAVYSFILSHSQSNYGLDQQYLGEEEDRNVHIRIRYEFLF